MTGAARLPADWAGIYTLRYYDSGTAQRQNIRNTLGNQFCRRCNYCQPCTMGINISFCFTINGYLTRYGLKDWAIGRYKGMAVEPNACIECGMCESRCPYHLPIIEMLKDVYSNFQKEMK